jgi:hypothetical protein
VACSQWPAVTDLQTKGFDSAKRTHKMHVQHVTFCHHLVVQLIKHNVTTIQGMLAARYYMNT